MPIPNVLLRLAASQHAVFSRQQALDHVRPDQVDGWRRHGRLDELHRGVYAIAGSDDTGQRRMMAAALRAGRGARVTGAAVLGLFDVDGFGPLDDFEVLVPAGRRISNVSFEVRPDPLPDVDVATFAEIPVAKLPLALVDTARMAPRLGDRALRVAVDSACWQKLTTRDAIAERARALPTGHGGAQWILDLERTGDLRRESEGERAVGHLADRLRPRPEIQVWVTPTIRVDLLWRPLWLVGEYDGEVDHPAGAPPDPVRTGELRDRGFEIVRFRASDLKDPDELTSRLQDRLDRRAAELGVRIL